MAPTFPRRVGEYQVMDTRGSAELGPSEKVRLFLELVNSADSDRFAVPTKRTATARLDRLGLVSVKQVIVIRDDGMFVPTVFLMPSEDDFAMPIMQKHVLAVKGAVPT